MSTIFPRWTNALPTVMAAALVGGLTLVVGGVWYYVTPKYWEVGYMPTQPGGGFSHQIHAAQLGMDCRYCHTNVDKSAEANIPSAATCMGCHTPGLLQVSSRSAEHNAKVGFIRDAYATDDPIPWRRVHKLPDYVRNFPHHAHVTAGVSCLSCHGNIARMPVVWQHESLSMGWCLDCHRNPEPSLVAREEVTRLFDLEPKFEPQNAAARLAEGKKFWEERKIAAPENCGACHY